MADSNEVMNGLDLCEGHGSNCTLEECPYYGTRLCVQDLHSDALALLKSQQAEIERLTKPEEEKQAERKRKRLEYNRKYKEAHRQQAYQTTKEWRKNNPDKWKAQQARYREKQRQKRLEGR